MRTLVAGLLCMLFCLLGAQAEVLSLTNMKGATIKVELVERGEISAKVKMSGKTFEIPYNELIESSVAAIKSAKIVPPSSDKMTIDVRMKKSGEIKKSGKVTRGRNGKVKDTRGSYRTDTVTGTITLANRHNEYPTKGGTMRVVVLRKGEERVSVMHSQSYPVSSLRSLSERKFEIDESKSKHRAKGKETLPRVGSGRYIGYIVAVYEGEDIVAIKSVPSIYETDRLTAVKLLESKPQLPK